VIRICIGGPGKKNPVAGLGDIVAGANIGRTSLQPLITPAVHRPFPDYITPGGNKPGTSGIRRGIARPDNVQQIFPHTLLRLIDTPALELGTPLGIGIAGPFPVLGSPVLSLGVTDFLPGYVKKTGNVIRNRIERRNHVLLCGGAKETEYRQQAAQTSGLPQMIPHGQRSFRKRILRFCRNDNQAFYIIITKNQI